MVIQPNSTIALYSGVEISEGEQLVFSSKAKQTEYFDSKRALVVNDSTINKKTGRLRVPGSFFIISTCNYMSFINPSLDNKVVFGRIIDYFYINNECAEVTYQIDFWQTWCFDVTFRSSYIEREHLSEADYQKSLVNPYDPTILEFKTSETLPVGKDIEKPYYTIGVNSATDDGVYCAASVENDLQLTDNIGVLLIFSGVSLSNADSGQTPGSTTSSATFVNRLLKVIYDSVVWSGTTITTSNKKSNMSFYQISGSIASYINDHYTGAGGRYAHASAWDNTSIGSLVPMSNSRIDSPASYVYIDGADSDHNMLLTNLLEWFIDNHCEDALLGLYPISNGMIAYSAALTSQTPEETGAIAVQIPTAKSQQVTNKKLDLYPFSYYRLIAPNGDVKELRIEDFRSAQLGQNNCVVGLCLDITETPNLLVAPKDYKMSNASPHKPASNLNLKEGLVFSQFPSLPYDTDSFRTQMASVSNNIIANNTIDYSYEIQQKQLDTYKEGAGVGSTVLGMIGDVLQGNFGSALQTGANAVFGGTQAELTYHRNQNEFNQSEGAYKTLSGNTDNAVYENFKYTKPAYVCDKYHQINGDGIINFNNYSFEDIILMRVSINPTILEQYDKYFDRFGYNSGRNGMPRVINFMHGSNVDADVPHWATVDGKSATYIKTYDIRVDHAMLPVSQAIANLFNSGCLFYKGDLT